MSSLTCKVLVVPVVPEYGLSAVWVGNEGHIRTSGSAWDRSDQTDRTDRTDVVTMFHSEDVCLFSMDASHGYIMSMLIKRQEADRVRKINL